VASTAIANYLLPQRLAALRRQQPDCRLSLHVANTRDIIAAVLDCVVDFGLVKGPCQPPELEVIPWLDDSEAIKRAAAAGLGISCLSRRVVAGDATTDAGTGAKDCPT
jgi:DNA-binding transcriptional LysR family regulator